MNKIRTDRVYLDVTHLPQHMITTRFPHIYRFCLDRGLDITRAQIPVAPAAHYMIGGVRTNSWGETNIRGLFACGEVACTSIHGANRLASNSLLEAVVFSQRIVNRTISKTAGVTSPAKADMSVRHKLSQRQGILSRTAPGLSALQVLLWEKVGILREKEGLTQAADTLVAWQDSLPAPADRPSYELSNLVLTGRLVVEAALLRKESRGAHFRSDYPERSSRWKRHIVFTRN